MDVHAPVKHWVIRKKLKKVPGLEEVEEGWGKGPHHHSTLRDRLLWESDVGRGESCVCWGGWGGGFLMMEPLHSQVASADQCCWLILTRAPSLFHTSIWKREGSGDTWPVFPYWEGCHLYEGADSGCLTPGGRNHRFCLSTHSTSEYHSSGSFSLACGGSQDLRKLRRRLGIPCQGGKLGDAHTGDKWWGDPQFPSNHSKPLFFCAIKGLQVTEVLSKITLACNLHGERSGSQGVHCIWEKKSLFVLTYHREPNMTYLCRHLQRNKKPFHDFKSCNDICCVLKHKQTCNLENIKKSQARNKFVHNHLTLISL